MRLVSVVVLVLVYSIFADFFHIQIMCIANMEWPFWESINSVLAPEIDTTTNTNIVPPPFSLC